MFIKKLRENIRLRETIGAGVTMAAGTVARCIVAPGERILMEKMKEPLRHAAREYRGEDCGDLQEMYGVIGRIGSSQF